MRVRAALMSLLFCASGVLSSSGLAGCAQGSGGNQDPGGGGDAALRDGGARDAQTPRDGSASDGGARDASARADGSVIDAGPAGPSDSGGRDAGPPPARCGDGRIDAPEICDDGNTAPGDGCSADCRSVECTGSATYEDPVTHHCYWRERNIVSRTAAVSACATGGGYLVRWGSTAERDAAYGPTLDVPGGRVWIGLQRVGDVWTWDDGTPSETWAIDFRPREPSGDGSCAEWGESNSLNDIPCGERRDYVCEREPAGTP